MKREREKPLLKKERKKIKNKLQEKTHARRGFFLVTTTLLKGGGSLYVILNEGFKTVSLEGAF